MIATNHIAERREMETIAAVRGPGQITNRLSHVRTMHPRNASVLPPVPNDHFARWPPASSVNKEPTGRDQTGQRDQDVGRNQKAQPAPGPERRLIDHPMQQQ